MDVLRHSLIQYYDILEWLIENCGTVAIVPIL
jgi:hypothetical protein